MARVGLQEANWCIWYRRRQAVRCKHCDTEIKSWDCERCHKRVTDQCKLCHGELVHDIIVPQFMRPQFGGKSDPAWADDEDAGGYGAIARRAMEDGL